MWYICKKKHLSPSSAQTYFFVCVCVFGSAMQMMIPTADKHDKVFAVYCCRRQHWGFSHVGLYVPGIGLFHVGEPGVYSDANPSERKNGFFFSSTLLQPFRMEISLYYLHGAERCLCLIRKYKICECCINMNSCNGNMESILHDHKS